MLKGLLKVGVVAAVVGGGLGFAVPVKSASAVRSACTCTMPELGSRKCATPTSEQCILGGWRCVVDCPD